MRTRTPFCCLVLVLAGCPDESATTVSPAATPSSATPQPTASTASSVTAAPSASASARPDEDARPLYYERAIEEADLKDRTLRELSLMRNTIYARAGNAFRRPWLNQHFTAQPWYEPRDKMDESQISRLDRENARKIAEHDAAIPTEQLERWRDELLARQKTGQPHPHDDVEISLLSQRLGTYLGKRDDGASPSPLEDPSQLDRVLTLEELSTLSRRDLRILRNTVYARHGRTFDSEVVRSYFSSATWYKPSNEYHNGMLTGIDHKNIAIIRSVEDSVGGPLHENPNYGKDGWFIAA